METVLNFLKEQWAKMAAGAVAGMSSFWAWLLSLGLEFLWGKISEGIKYLVSKWKNERHIEENEAAKEKLREETEEAMKDGLTPEEEAEIRRKKVALEESGFNDITRD